MDSQKLTDEIIKKDFPEIWRWLEEDNVTDLDFNCGNLWLTTIYEFPKPVKDDDLTARYMENFSKVVGRSSNCNFNPVENTAIADTETLRITCLHESQSRSGICVCIRKFSQGLRLTRELALETGYCDEKTMNLVNNGVLAGQSIIFCGLPGDGKTEGMKFFASGIPKYKKVITIEDVGEINYPVINPGASCSEMKVIKGNYKECMERALRMNAQWILYGESRGSDAIYLLECMSNGIPCMTSIHTGDARNVTDRMLNMINDRRDADRIVNQLHNDIGISLLIKRKADSMGKVRRRIEQICFYSRQNGTNNRDLIVEDGKLYPDRIPNFIRNQIEEETGCGIFENRKREECI